jgi:FtsP/CotA-like multicopper oxidase with cupredoxin domain
MTQHTDHSGAHGINRRDMLRAAGATALVAAGAGTAEANPIRRCTAPEFLKANEVDHPAKWERPLVQPADAGIPEARPVESEKFEPTSPTARRNWDARYPAHAAKPAGWIALEDIRRISALKIDKKTPLADRSISKIYKARTGDATEKLSPPLVRHPQSSEEAAVAGKPPTAGHTVHRYEHKIAPEFWGVEGAFDPEHFWRRLELMGETRVPLYIVTLGELEAEIVPGIRTPVWGYNRQVPGPSFVAEVMGPMVVRFINELPMEASVHLHGGHTPAHSDGHPAFLICAKEDTEGKPKPFHYRDYFYTNGVPKKAGEVPLANPYGKQGSSVDLVKAAKAWDWDESGSTMWYHDHANDITAHNALMGLAGFFIVTDAWERHLVRKKVLPRQDWNNKENSRDIPMVFGDRCICEPSRDEIVAAGEKPIGRIHFDPFDHNGYLGTIPICNGMAFPVLNVKKEKYRMRFLNGSLARVFLMELWVTKSVPRNVKGAGWDRVELERVTMPWVRIGKDSWLFPRGVADDSILLGMANRADVIVDFAALAKRYPKKVFFLVNACDQRNGRGPGHGDNGFAVADAQNNRTKLPRGHLEDVPNLGDAERMDAFRDAEGGSEWTKEPTFRVVRIEVDEVGGNADACVYPMNEDELKSLWQERADAAAQLAAPVSAVVQSAPEQRTSAKMTAFEKAEKALLKSVMEPGERPPDVTPERWAMERAEILAAAGEHLRGHKEMLDEVPKELYDKLPIRIFEFERGRGAWRVSHKFFHEERTDAPIRLGGMEVWHLINRSGGWWHPIHIHLESHQQISVVFDGKNRARQHPNNPEARGQAEILPQDRFKHDTTTLGPNTHVIVLMRFRTFLGPIVFHCHNLNHEDMRMMSQFDPQLMNDEHGSPVPMVPEEIVKKKLPWLRGSRPVQQMFGDHC